MLATKLRIPPPTQHLVRRARLVDTLERGVFDYRLTLIAAPAGYGKTTLLAQWAHVSRFPVAWLSISEGDNDPDRFLRYLLRAWEEVQPDVGASSLGVLLGAMTPDRETVLSAFINVANDIPDQTVFVLDDYHLIEDAAVHQALAFLLDHRPPTLHFVLAGRGEPPLPLARYRARHELLELRTEELQFLADETAEFLNRRMGLDLADDEIVAMQSQLEGWIAGLQLASLTLRRHREAADTLIVSGRHRHIADYLSQDVIAHLPETHRQFLLQTSILDRLCGSLCDAVGGRGGSQEMLERLERENLFLVPLDDDRTWFRYHRLFAGFLQAELRRRRPDELAQCHRRATEWFLAHDQPESAFRHAVDAADVDLVIQIAELYFAPTLFGGEFRVVNRWLASFPEAWYTSHPLLGLAQVTFLVITGALEAGVRALDGVELTLMSAEREDKPRQLAKVAAIRCAIACFQNDLPLAESYADHALRDLRDEDRSYRADTYHALGDTYRRHGRWKEAKDCYLMVLDVSPDPAARLRLAHVFGALADLELGQGRLQAAAGYWDKALGAVQARENWGRLPLPVIGWVYLRMSELRYEHNDVAGAWDYLCRGLERAEFGGDTRALIAGYLMAGRVKLTEGDVAAAAAYLERARPLVDQAPTLDWTSRLERSQLELWFAQDRLRTAVDWAAAMLDRGDSTAAPPGEPARLALAHVLILKGDERSRRDALEILDRLADAAVTGGRMGVRIEALILQAMARWRAGDRADAMISFERSLGLAEPEGYVRLFIDYGQPVIQLLHEARRRGVLPGYVNELLAAAGGDPGGTLPAQTMLAEPLSDREQEVLGLMAAGLTNREIAADLSIAAETVKKHTSSIFGKLGVANRTEAAAKARGLDLLT
ncbi:MAG: LuxR C-terminal-related transcriptional regulator [Chloroflexota bacterium]|nr:LuxR C-terminal-related transcriptional regulator [Chloroflexota bacterium]